MKPSPSLRDRIDQHETDLDTIRPIVLGITRQLAVRHARARDQYARTLIDRLARSFVSAGVDPLIFTGKTLFAASSPADD